MLQYRLGFPVKIISTPLRSHDSRRWQNQPHLSVSLAYLRDILEHLHQYEIGFYRMSGQLAPYLTHPDFPQFHYQIEECTTELAAIGDLARLYGIRLTMHPGHYIQLSSDDPQRVQRSRHELHMVAKLLDGMGLEDDAVIVIHIGGAYGEPEVARERFVRNFGALSPAAKRRIALENDDRIFGIQDTYWIHQRTGIRLVLDTLHHRCVDRGEMPLVDALALAVQSWPPHQKPKIHFSSPRTALRQSIRHGKRHWQLPLPNQHSDFIHPFEFIDFLYDAQSAGVRPFDIMLEAKGKELALVRLREQIVRYAPELSPLVG